MITIAVHKGHSAQSDFSVAICHSGVVVFLCTWGVLNRLDIMSRARCHTVIEGN